MNMQDYYSMVDTVLENMEPLILTWLTIYLVLFVLQ